MDFSYMKRAVLKPRKEKKASTFFIAMAVAAALFLPYMIQSDGYFTFYGDFNVQQIPFYQECHGAVKSGNIFWNWNTDLGANFIGSYSFYLLGSPFFWLTLPFPNSFVPYLMGPLLILKFACAALTAYLFIRRFTRTPDAARIGGLLYAFSGFSIYNIFFNHFHEAIIFFPLLLLSLELLITENRRFVFALMVFACALVNYFFFFGMVIFCIIYYFVRVFSSSVKFKFSNFAVIVFEAVLGLGLAMIMLLPAILAITDNYRVSEFLTGWNAIMYGKEQIYGNVLQCFFFPPDIPARPIFFPSADVKWSSLGGWLPLFSMVGVFTWFAKKKRNWVGRLLGICIFMSMVPILNSAFYAFNTSYYARWFYMPILIICMATVMLTEDKEIDWSYGYKWVMGITITVALVIGFFPQENSDGTYSFGIYTRSKFDNNELRFYVACLIAIISLALFGMLLILRNKNLKHFYNASLASICIISIVYGNVFIYTGRQHSYEIKGVVIESLIEGKVDLGDQSQFRVDVYDCADNTSMYLGLPGINAFHSIVPSSIFEFYDYIGVERSVGSRPDTEVEALRPLLSVKYLLNRIDGDDFIDSETHEGKMPGYEYAGTQLLYQKPQDGLNKTEDFGYYIYENKNYIPYGFSYDHYMTEEFCESYSENRRPALMLKAILLTDEQIEKYGYMYENLEEIEHLGYYGEKRLSWEISDATLEYDSEQRALTSAYEFKTDNRGFTAKVLRTKETLVFFSVPYDKGWSATVNGVAAEIEKVNAGFMAVKVPEGDSEIRFNYMTPGLEDGIKITAISAGVLLIYILVFVVYKKKHPSVNCYPEGDALLKEWNHQELEEPWVTEEEKKKDIFYIDDELEISESDDSFGGGFVINTEFDKDDNEESEN